MSKLNYHFESGCHKCYDTPGRVFVQANHKNPLPFTKEFYENIGHYTTCDCTAAERYQWMNRKYNQEKVPF